MKTKTEIQNILKELELIWCADKELSEIDKSRIHAGIKTLKWVLT